MRLDQWNHAAHCVESLIRRKVGLNVEPVVFPSDAYRD